MRKKIVAGNWKMNLNYDEVGSLVDEILTLHSSENNVEVILSPPFVYLDKVIRSCANHDHVLVASQNCSEYNNGAYTGEVSASMLNSMGVNYVIIGHSERRSVFNESNENLNLKITKALQNNLKIIFCCGENIDQRESGEYLQVIRKQLEETILSLEQKSLSRTVIAYEPIWAIGTGKTASSVQAQEIHSFIRSLISNKFGTEISNNTSILYGGSCKPINSKELFSQYDIDGGLIGGASLKSSDFVAIINSF
ncbi:triose-phosphate isomerase [bacterium]|nr:triose-phosphate isomerase [bacterium]